MIDFRPVGAPWSALAAASVLLLAGCQIVPNNARDEIAMAPPVTTASVEAALAAETEPLLLRTDNARLVRYPASGEVLHLPLWFEDPYEGLASDDDRFAWTPEDIWYAIYGPARFVINGLFVPVSAVVNPPWQVMVSDGVYEKRCWQWFDPEPLAEEAPPEELLDAEEEAMPLPAEEVLDSDLPRPDSDDATE